MTAPKTKTTPAKSAPANPRATRAKKAVEAPVQARPGGFTSTNDLLAFCLTQLDDGKASEGLVLEIAPLSSIADWFVIANGTSSRHVRSLAENLEDALRKRGFKEARMDGLGEGRWVVVDLGDIMIHLFQEEVRRHYDLEGMWSSALREEAPACLARLTGKRRPRAAKAAD